MAVLAVRSENRVRDPLDVRVEAKTGTLERYRPRADRGRRPGARHLQAAVILDRRPEREQHERRSGTAPARRPSSSAATEISAAAIQAAGYASSWRWCSQYAVRPIVTRLPSSVAAATAVSSSLRLTTAPRRKDGRRGEHGEHEDRERKLPATRLLEEVDCDTEVLDRSPDEPLRRRSGRSRSGRCT